MKNSLRLLQTSLFLITAAIAAIQLLYCPIAELQSSPRGDFMLRYNESQCLKRGIDPFDIWRRTVKSTDFYSLHDEPPNMTARRVHAYPAWAYTYFLPLSFLKPGLAYKVFVLVEIMGLVFALACIFKKGSLLGTWEEGPVSVNCGFLAIIAFCVCGGGFNSAWITGNFSWMVLFALMAMAHFLDKDEDFLAGLCLALAMTKPQMAALFSVPLFWAGKWKTLCVGGVVCFLAMLYPVAILRKSPVSLILQIPKIGSPFVHETLLFPKFVFDVFPNGIVFSAVLGVTICSLFALGSRRNTSWFVRLAPAAVLSTAWTYCLGQDTILYAWTNLFLFFYCSRVSSRFKKFLAIMTGLLLASSYLKTIEFFRPPTGLPVFGKEQIATVVSWCKRFGVAFFLFLFRDYLKNRDSAGAEPNPLKHQ